MASPTVPTVALPIPTDDTDDDDDDDVTSLVPAPVATTPPAQPPPGQTLPSAPVPPPAATSPAGQPAASAPGVPGAPASTLIPNASPASRVPSGSPTRLADTLPSGSSNSTSSANSNSSGGGGLSSGAAAGIGIGVALAVILMAIGAWFYLRIRRRKSQQQQRKTSKSTYNGDSPDEEVAQRSVGPDVRAYYAGGASELPNAKEVSTGDPRRPSELASPIVAQEVHGDREFAVELPGSAVPAAAATKSGEGWSSPPPIYEQVPPRQEKKSGVRLFDDAPIDDISTPVDVEDRPRMMDRKGGF